MLLNADFPTGSVEQALYDIVVTGAIASPIAAAALRGAVLARGRIRGAYTAAAAAAALRHPAQLATAATALPYA